MLPETVLATRAPRRSSAAVASSRVNPESTPDSTNELPASLGTHGTRHDSTIEKPAAASRSSTEEELRDRHRDRRPDAPEGGEIVNRSRGKALDHAVAPGEETRHVLADETDAERIQQAREPTGPEAAMARTRFSDDLGAI